MPVRRHPRALLAVCALVLAGVSCSSPSEPAEPSSITLSAASSPLDAIGATRVITAIVRDQKDKVMSGVTGVVWSSNAVGVATVSNVGLVTATGVGTATITATIDGLSATVAATVTQVAVAPVVVSGNFQSAPVSGTLGQPIVVRITDRLGVAMAGQDVTFAVLSGGGSLSATTVTSDAAGLAQTTWTLGAGTVVPQRVTAAVSGVPNTTLFSATALAGPPTQMLVAPGNTANGQIGTMGQAVTTLPAVEVRDVLGNPVAGASVTFAVTAGGGSLTGGTAVTDGSGIATVGSWTLGPAAGVNTLTASLGALTPVVFTANGVADRCAAEGAQPMTVGVTVASNLGATDCQAVFAEGTARFEFYRLTLVATTPLVLDMASSVFDTWLSIYDFNTLALIAENDDIIRATNTNSRVAVTLNAGTYLIRARGFDGAAAGNFTLLARAAQVGVATRAIPTTPNGQVAAPGATTGVAPALTVVDDLGDPVAGVTVNFETIGGIGSIASTSVVTNASGIATAGSWTLAAGANVVVATVVSPNAVTNSPTIYSAKGKASSAGFDINLRFASVPTASQLAAFSTAAARWETIITGDIASQALQLEVGDCGSSFAINETIDDLAIVVQLQPIDGVNNILGSAGPCVSRAAPVSFAALGTMEFDTADLDNLQAGGGLGDVILHEMGHVLGIGTIWATKGFLVNPSPLTGTGNDTHFSGANAVAAFNATGGSTYTGGGKVPVENNQGGAGTRNSHWREGVLDRELMTGFYDGGVANPLSIITVQSLRDLGYTVDNAGADSFAFTSSLMAEGSRERFTGKIFLGNDVRQIPPIIVDRRGRPIGAPPLRPKATKPVR